MSVTSWSLAQMSHTDWCVVVYELETSRMKKPWPALGCSAIKKMLLIIYFHIESDFCA